jgi:hypothetical protein
LLLVVVAEAMVVVAREVYLPVLVLNYLQALVILLLLAQEVVDHQVPILMDTLEVMMVVILLFQDQV